MIASRYLANYRRIAAGCAVGALCLWAAGCSDDDDNGPARTGGVAGAAKTGGKGGGGGAGAAATGGTAGKAGSPGTGGTATGGKAGGAGAGTGGVVIAGAGTAGVAGVPRAGSAGTLTAGTAGLPEAGFAGVAGTAGVTTGGIGGVAGAPLAGFAGIAGSLVAGGGAGGHAGTAGAAGVLVAGAAGTAGTEGRAGAAGAFPWPDGYNPAQLPAPATGHHNAGQDCMGCHAADTAGGRPRFLFAGTVFQANVATPLASVSTEVGVSIGTTTYAAYSAQNGNFWVLAGTIPALTAADMNSSVIRVRDADDELAMPQGLSPTTGCNSCHSDATGAAAPPISIP